MGKKAWGRLHTNKGMNNRDDYAKLVYDYIKEGVLNSPTRTFTFTSDSLYQHLRDTYPHYNLPKPNYDKRDDTLSKACRELCTNLRIRSNGERAVYGWPELPATIPGLVLMEVREDGQRRYNVYTPTKKLLELGRDSFASAVGGDTESLKHRILKEVEGFWQNV